MKKMTHSKNNSNKNVKAGLGGWLIVVGLGLILGPILGLLGFLGYISLLLENIGIPGFAAVLWVELTFQTIFLVAGIYLLYLFFKKNKKFPKYYIIFLYYIVVWTAIVCLMVTLLSAPTAELAKFLDEYLHESTKAMTKTIVSSSIWIIYMHKSKRVKATFVKN